MTMRTVHIAIYDGLADWELGYVSAAINDPRWHARPGTYETKTVALAPEPITTMGGLRVTPDVLLHDLTPVTSAMLVLPGSSGWDAGTLDGDRWAGAAQRFLGCGVPVAAICGATLGLAAAGLLDDRAHTSAAPEYLALAARYGGREHYVSTDAVNDDGLITAGPAQPVASAREVIAELGAFAPETLDAWFGLYSTGESQFFFDLMSAATA